MKSNNNTLNSFVNYVIVMYVKMKFDGNIYDGKFCKTNALNIYIEIIMIISIIYKKFMNIPDDMKYLNFEAGECRKKFKLKLDENK